MHSVRSSSSTRDSSAAQIPPWIIHKNGETRSTTRIKWPQSSTRHWKTVSANTGPSSPFGTTFSSSSSSTRTSTCIVQEPTFHLNLSQSHLARQSFSQVAPEHCFRLPPSITNLGTRDVSLCAGSCHWKQLHIEMGGRGISGLLQ
jgi:hypothetical protein